MVKIDFDRPGLDSSWGAAHKTWDGFPPASTTQTPKNSPTERKARFANDKIVDLDLHPEIDFELMTVLAEDLAREKNVDLEPNPQEEFELMTEKTEDLTSEEHVDVEPNPKDNFGLETISVEDLANEKEPDLGHKPHDDLEPMTQGAPTDEKNVKEGVIDIVPESKKRPLEESELDEDFLQFRLQVQKERRMKTKRPGFDCWSFFTNLLKPQPSQAQLELGPAPLPVAASVESDLDRVLRESASLNEAKELSAGLAQVRLQSVMEKYKAKVRPVEGDGNCQFRALALQLYGDESQHAEVRADMVQWLQHMKERYSDFVHEPYVDYLERMACNGTWGDNVTLQAASDMLQRDIHVLNDQPGAEHVLLHPAQEAQKRSVLSCHSVDGVTGRPLWLAFLAEVHYDAVEFL